jgi:chromosome segregation ATPase
MLLKDEFVAQQQRNLEYQQNAKTKAEEHLDLRLKELNGDPDRANQNLDKYLIAGYHKAVADLEVDRNRVQANVDELRRLVKRTRDEIDRLTRENERLADERSGEVPQTATNKQQ